MLRKFEVWNDPENNSIALSPSSGIKDELSKGTLSKKSRRLFELQAATFEEARAIQSLRLGWGPYIPNGDPKPCPKCKKYFYPNGSGECWSCSIKEGSEGGEEKFIVQHMHILNKAEEIKLIGVYDSERLAKRAVATLRKKPGFKSKGRFYIDKYKVNETYWNEGFITVKSNVSSPKRRRKDKSKK